MPALRPYGSQWIHPKAREVVQCWRRNWIHFTIMSQVDQLLALADTCMSLVTPAVSFYHTVGPNPFRQALFWVRASAVVGANCFITTHCFFFTPTKFAKSITDTLSFSLPAQRTHSVRTPLSSIVFLGSILELTGVWSTFQITIHPILLP